MEDGLRNRLPIQHQGHPYLTRFNLLRWLQQSDLDEVIAAERLARHLRLRQQLGLDEKDEDVDPMAAVYAPVSILGRNGEDDNKVVAFEFPGLYDLEGLMRSVQATSFMKGRFRQMDELLARVQLEEQRSGRQSSAILVFDLQKLTWDSHLLNVITGPFRIMWGNLIEQYPQLIDKILIVNAPTFMNVLYAACSPFIPEPYKNKIIVAANRDDITAHIGIDFLPVYYGGSLRDQFGDERCRSLLTLPPTSRVPRRFPMTGIADSLKMITIPAGGLTEERFELEAQTLLEFYVQHDQECTMGIFLTKNDGKNEDEVEVYAESERPGLPSIDQWHWTCPETGLYILRFGNVKAWFASVSVKYRIDFAKTT